MHDIAEAIHKLEKNTSRVASRIAFKDLQSFGSTTLLPILHVLHHEPSPHERLRDITYNSLTSI